MIKTKTRSYNQNVYRWITNVKRRKSTVTPTKGDNFWECESCLLPAFNILFNIFVAPDFRCFPFVMLAPMITYCSSVLSYEGHSGSPSEFGSLKKWNKKKVFKKWLKKELQIEYWLRHYKLSIPSYISYTLYC